jgi:dipeptidyl aminopeptidase/acylaminoacyl peptidase
MAVRHFKLLLAGVAIAGGMEASAQEWAKAASLSPAPKLPVNAFAQLERMLSPSVSPDGKRIAYLTTLNGRKHVVIKPLDPAMGQPAIMKPSVDGFEYRWLQWANNERVLVGLGAEWKRAYAGTVAWDDRTRETRLISVSTDGKSVTNMYKPKKVNKVGSRFGEVTNQTNVQQQDNVIHLTPNDPDTFLLSAYDDYATDLGVSVRKVNAKTGSFDVIQSPKRGVYHFVADLAGNVRLGFGMTSAGNSVYPFISYRDPDTGGWTNFKDSPLTSDTVSFIDFTPNPLFAYVLMPVDRRISLVKVDMRTQKMAEVLVRDQNFDVIQVFRDGKKNVIGVKLASGQDIFIDKTWAARFAGLKKALAGNRLDFEAISDDGQFAVVKAISPTEPGAYYVYSIAQKSVTPIEFAYAGLGPENAAYRQSVKYKVRDGLEIEAFLTLPRGQQPKNLPTVLLPHGGPWAHDDINYEWHSQFLANRGYAVLQPNFRGSTGYGQDFMDKGNGQWGLAMQDDLTDSVDWLVKNGITDKNRVCIVGGSYGGFAALMGAVKTPDLFKCASSLNGVSDIVQLLGDDSGRFKSESTNVRIGDREKDMARLRATSPINNIDKIKTPILLVHAKDDLRVDIKQSYRMRDKLQSAGKTVEFLEIKDGEHWLENEAARNSYLTALEAFLGMHIGKP